MRLSTESSMQRRVIVQGPGTGQHTFLTDVGDDGLSTYLSGQFGDSDRPIAILRQDSTTYTYKLVFHVAA